MTLRMRKRQCKDGPEAWAAWWTGTTDADADKGLSATLGKPTGKDDSGLVYCAASGL